MHTNFYIFVTMKFTAEQIAGILEGTVIGNPEAEVFKLSKIEEGTEGSLSFLSNSKYQNYIYTTQASVVIINNNFKPEKPVKTTLIKVDDAYGAFSKILEFYSQVKNNKVGIEALSVISETAKYGEALYLGSFSYVGENVIIGNNVIIGDNSTLFAGVKIHSETEIGANCNIYSGCVIGADGFGFAPNEDGTFTKIPQIGNVIIEDNVSVGASTTIDRATMGSTIIRKGVKLDNLIQIAHNAEIGQNTVIASQTGVSGSSKIGEGSIIGGQVGIVGHLTIGNNVRIQAQSGVGKNIKDNEILQGSPAFGYSHFSKSFVHFKNLPKIVSELEELKKKTK